MLGVFVPGPRGRDSLPSTLAHGGGTLGGNAIRPCWKFPLGDGTCPFYSHFTGQSKSGHMAKADISGTGGKIPPWEEAVRDWEVAA